MTNTANEIKAALLAHQSSVANAAAGKIFTESRENVREKYESGLAGWNASWSKFWDVVERCNFNDSFWIDGFKSFSSDTISNVKHGEHAALEIWSYSIFLAGCVATSGDLETFTPVDRVTA